jgi:phosphate acyltransferase
MASAFLKMGRLAGIERPAIAVKLPTLNASDDGCVLLDVGANVDCKPTHLRDFAIMGALFSRVERKNANPPRVALLSNGEETSKGNELTREALRLIEPLACFRKGPDQVGEFTGYTEGKDLFKGRVDVVVTDGFAGNLVLKSIEGLGSSVVTLLKRLAKTSPLASLGLLFASSMFLKLKNKLDYAEYGAAPLLGVAGYVFICHGRSNAKAIKNALLRARTALNERIVERLSELQNKIEMTRAGPAGPRI